MQYVITGRRSSGEVLHYSKNGDFTAQDRIFRLFDTAKAAYGVLNNIETRWKGLELSVVVHKVY